jgi:energy-converting hydrogenase B subunit D
VSVLIAVVLTLVAIAATAVVFVDEPVRQSMVSSMLGLALTSAFFVLQAPDVALSMMAVSSILIPALVLLSLARIRAIAGQDERAAGEEDDR